MSLSLNLESCTNSNSTPIETSVNWSKLSPSDLQRYSDRLWMYTEASPSHVMRCDTVCGCREPLCHQRLQEEYDALPNCVKKASTAIPRQKPGVQKDWWTPDLTRLRDQARDIQKLWIHEGRPRHGPTHFERLRVRAAYKKMLRTAKRAPKQAAWNRLHSAMETKDTTSFWKWWRSIYSKNSKKAASVVEGCTTKETLASVFEENFKNNCRPNNGENVAQLNEKFEHSYAEFSADHALNCDCSLHVITISNVIDALGNMKRGKSPDDDGIQAEHFLNSPFNVLVRLTALFNAMLHHGFVPSQFRYGTIIPIVKDRQASNRDVNNYRGITISPIGSKLF